MLKPLWPFASIRAQFAGEQLLSRRFAYLADYFASSHSDLLRVIPSYSDQINVKTPFSTRFAHFADLLFALAIRTNPDKTPPPPAATLLIFRHLQPDTL